VNPDNPNIYEIQIVTERQNGHPTSFYDHYYAKSSSTIPKNSSGKIQPKKLINNQNSDVGPSHMVNISDDDASSGFSAPNDGPREMVPNSNSNGISRDVKRLATNGYADFVFGSHVPGKNKNYFKLFRKINKML
jgi:hypothetical protein